MMKLEIFLNHTEWNQITELYIVGTDHKNARFVVEPMDMKLTKYEPGLMCKPSLTFSNEMGMQFLPAMRDAIIRAGYNDKQTDLEQIKYHLEDMRKLVFKVNG